MAIEGLVDALLPDSLERRTRAQLLLRDFRRALVGCRNGSGLGRGRVVLFANPPRNIRRTLQLLGVVEYGVAARVDPQD